MAAPNRGLGRGLDALLGGLPKDAKDPQVRLLSIPSIQPNPKQPRRSFDETALNELADSIRSQGVLQPILVRPQPDRRNGYELVAGERRWRAAQLAGLGEIPALIREMSEQESLAVALVENLQREDLNILEEAKGFHDLQDRFGLSQDELARYVGKSRSAVANTLRLLQLPDNMQLDLSAGTLSAGHARALMSITDPAMQSELRDRILAAGLSVRQAEAQAAHWKAHGSLPREGGQGKRKSMDGVEDEFAAAQAGTSATAHAQTLDTMENDIAHNLGVRVKCSGNAGKGRISLYFTSEEERESLLRTLTRSPA